LLVFYFAMLRDNAIVIQVCIYCRLQTQHHQSRTTASVSQENSILYFTNAQVIDDIVLLHNLFTSEYMQALAAFKW
jgi:hypothetical protein